MENNENDQLKDNQNASENTSNTQVLELDSNAKEILKKANKQKPLTQSEIDKLLKAAQDSIEFLKKIDEIELEQKSFVIFTDGNEQLFYDDGEFFLINTVDSKKARKKLKKQEAKDLYIEYFIKYQLNPILKQKQLNQKIHTISIEKQKTERVKSNTKVQSKTSKEINQRVKQKEIKKQPTKETRSVEKKDELIR